MTGRRTTGLARGLRRRQTDAERKLWSHLRSRQLASVKFRRQHPIGRYIADFACPERKLVIELDGSQHGGMADRERDRGLAAQGWHVLRFWDNEILSQTEAVLEMILAVADSPSPQPSPVQGRGKNRKKLSELTTRKSPLLSEERDRVRSRAGSPSRATSHAQGRGTEKPTTDRAGNLQRYVSDDLAFPLLHEERVRMRSL